MGIAASASALADNALRPITDLSEFSQPQSEKTIQWSNQRPEQQRALNQFYQSINPTQAPTNAAERQNHVQELRNMSPQQRQQMFLNYIQQNR